MRTILIIILLVFGSCATKSHSKCDAYGSVSTSKDVAKK